MLSCCHVEIIRHCTIGPTCPQLTWMSWPLMRAAASVQHEAIGERAVVGFAALASALHRRLSAGQLGKRWHIGRLEVRT
jgi:hypothetical protein